MTDAQIYGGTLLATEDDRTYRARLVPFKEEARSNLGRFSVDAGIFEIPADLTGAAFNVDHERELVSGTLTAMKEQDDGIWTELRFAKTTQGDKALEDVVSGRRRGISVEAADVIIKAGKAISGRIFGAALVKDGAFPSATLLAAAEDTPPVAPIDPAAAAEPSTTWPKVTVEKNVATVKDAEGNEEKQTTTKTTKVEEDGTTTITTTVVTEPADNPAPTQEGDPTVTVPNTLTAGKAATTDPRPAGDINAIAAAIAELRSNPHAPEARTLLASLNDVVISGGGALPAGGSVLQPNWMGLLDQGDTYERQYVGLGQTGTDITAAGKKGFTVSRGTSGSPVDSYAAAADWAGNKASIFSGQGFTASKQSVLDRFAIGEDIGREFYDLPGGAESIIAFLALLDEDHKVWSDLKALNYWQQAAGLPVAAATYPDGYPDTLGMIIQGILAVKKRKSDMRRDTPTFAILNDAAYTELLYTPFENIPEYIKFSVNTDGTGLGDGDVLMVNGDTGIVDTPSVMVGAKKAIQFDELAGGPLHVDALNIANGGIDKAVHGYLQTFIVRPQAVKTIGVADTRANSTAYSLGRLIKASAIVYRVVVAGTSGSSAPSAPAVGSTVADGTATLLRLV